MHGRDRELNANEKAEMKSLALAIRPCLWLHLLIPIVLMLDIVDLSGSRSELKLRLAIGNRAFDSSECWRSAVVECELDCIWLRHASAPIELDSIDSSCQKAPLIHCARAPTLRLTGGSVSVANGRLNTRVGDAR